MNPIGAQGQGLAHGKQPWQTLIQLVEAKPGEMPCEENTARVLASMGIASPEGAAKATTSVKPAIVLCAARRHKQEEKQG
ncbi:MerR family transcriptional regulator [Aeromonas caviae]|uniref:hypothetical protein n=1 Tax=Aeromonas caviae TaxID=648 RepID=UPI002B4630AB|nr:hypothetical protein [Aeromonas caviae]